MSPISDGSDLTIDPVSADSSAQAIHWRGIGKLAEECGEVLQVVGKAIAFPNDDHPDGNGPVRARFIEELAYLYAALDYFCKANHLPDEPIARRRQQKLEQFHRWGLSGVTPRDET